jgi:hypothetical protein
MYKLQILLVLLLIHRILVIFQMINPRHFNLTMARSGPRFSSGFSSRLTSSSRLSGIEFMGSVVKVIVAFILKSLAWQAGLSQS